MSVPPLPLSVYQLATSPASSTASPLQTRHVSLVPTLLTSLLPTPTRLAFPVPTASLVQTRQPSDRNRAFQEAVTRLTAMNGPLFCDVQMLQSTDVDIIKEFAVTADWGPTAWTMVRPSPLATPKTLPYFNQLSVLKLNILREYHMLCLLFSIIKTRSPSYLSENFNFLSNISERVTRQGSSTIAIPIHRTAIYNKSFTVSVSRLWNSLPNHLKTIEMRARFGAELRAWLLAASRGR